jgi:hypothetical protein
MSNQGLFHHKVTKTQSLGQFYAAAHILSPHSSPIEKESGPDFENRLRAPLGAFVSLW